MSGFFAPPHLFSAQAVHAPDDPDLAPGAHLRLMPSPLLGFGIAPFLVWTMQPSSQRLMPIWEQRGTYSRETPDLSAGGESLGMIIEPSTDDEWRVGVELLAVGDAEFEVRALDASRRLLAVRRRPPYLLALPDIRFIHVRGRGRIEAVIGHFVSDARLRRALEGQAPAAVLALPVEDRPRYAGGEGRGRCLERVERGAPRRHNPMDRPDGPFDALTPGDELHRVHELTPGIDERVEALLEEDGRPVWQRRLTAETAAGATAPWQRVEAPLASNLLLQGLDPGIGRYLGLMTCLDDPAIAPPQVLAAVSVFAFDPQRELPGTLPGMTLTLDTLIGAPHADEGQIRSRFARSFGRFQALADELTGRGHRVQGFATAALVAPLPEVPGGPTLAAGDGRWLASDAPSNSYSRAIELSDMPLAGLCAFGRLTADGWRSLHPPADPGARRQAMLPGKGPKPGTAVLHDARVPADGDPDRYRVALGDLFGRFGPAAEIDVPPPPRPKLPTPVIEAVIDYAATPAGSAAASPGRLQVRVPTPSIAERAAGSLPLAALKLEVGDSGIEPIDIQADAAVRTYDLPALTPGTGATIAIRAAFVDTEANESGWTGIGVDFTDRRRPIVVESAKGLIWTSRPGASADVELRLSWAGRPHERYRVYLADARRLGVATAGLSRAGVARAIGRLGTVGDRGAFRLMTDPPLEAGADGRVSFVGTLPRTLSAVQAIRVVPVFDNNLEAPFEASGLVPVAVPPDDAPPPPAVSAIVDPATGKAVVTIVSTGVATDGLAAAEPGLLEDPPSDEARRPEFRLRRAIGRGADPFYARVLARGDLEPVSDDGTTSFEATHGDGPDDGLLPYVQYSYWAEVRRPPERRFAPAPGEVPEPDLPPGADGVSATQDAQLVDAPGMFSSFSLPATVMRVPATPPTLADATIEAVVRADVTDSARYEVSLSVTGAPTAHPRAVGPMRLRLWQQANGGTILPVGPDVALADGKARWTARHPLVDGAVPDVMLHAAIVDPVGRTGPVVAVRATAA